MQRLNIAFASVRIEIHRYGKQRGVDSLIGRSHTCQVSATNGLFAATSGYNPTDGTIDPTRNIHS